MRDEELEQCAYAMRWKQTLVPRFQAYQALTEEIACLYAKYLVPNIKFHNRDREIS